MSILQLKPNSIQLAAAQKFADAYNTLGYGKNVLGVSHDEYIFFIRIGKLCELVLADYLQQEYIEYEAKEILKPHAGNHKKGADLTLLHSGQEVDIKAANKSFHTRILIREDQFQAHKHDVYIGAKYISDIMVEYHGYSTGKDLEAIPPQDFGYGMCRYMLLDKLKSMQQFITLCKEKKVIL